MRTRWRRVLQSDGCAELCRVSVIPPTILPRANVPFQPDPALATLSAEASISQWLGTAGRSPAPAFTAKCRNRLLFFAPLSPRG